MVAFEEKISLMGLFEFIAIGLERHPEQRFDWWLYVSLLIFCKDFLFFVGSVIMLD